MNPGGSNESPGFFFLPFSSGTAIHAAIHADGDEHKKRRGCPFEGDSFGGFSLCDAAVGSPSPSVKSAIRKKNRRLLLRCKRRFAFSSGESTRTER